MKTEHIVPRGYCTLWIVTIIIINTGEMLEREKALTFELVYLYNDTMCTLAHYTVYVQEQAKEMTINSMV